MLRFQIQSDPVELKPTRKKLEQFFSDANFHSAACDDIGLCVNEALANIMRHAYGGAKDRPIEIVAQIDRDGEKETAIIQLRDWGNGMHPHDVPPKPEAHDPLLPGGIGMLCLETLTDSIVFTRQRDGMLTELRRGNAAAKRPNTVKPKT